MAAAGPTTDILERLPPQNLDAERSVLACMLLANEMIDEVADIIQPGHFYLDSHRVIAEGIFRLYETSSGGIDPVTLAEKLEHDGTLEEIGGPSYLASILETVPHAAHAKYYADIVRDKWMLRTLREACTQIIRDVYENQDDPRATLSRAEQRIFQILELKGQADNLEIGDILMEAFDNINQRWLNEGKLPGLSTGFRDLDELTNGLHFSELVILAARPSMGKTAFVCNITEAVATEAKRQQSEAERAAATHAKHGVLLFSLEQSKYELAERFLCIFTKVDGHKLKKGELDSDEKNQVQMAASVLSELPIYIDDQPGRTTAEVAAIARRMKRRYDISLVIIDYLQLIEPEDKHIPREQQVAITTRRLKNIAKELNIPVIALAQLNRGVELRTEKQPRLADLRESGAIEQDADMVMFLHRPETYDPADRPGEADVIVAKNRNGRTGVVTLAWLRQSMRFEDFSSVQEPEGGYFGSGDSF